MKKLLYFTAPWCKACHMLEPHIDRAKKIVEVEKIDLSLFPRVGEQYGIQGLPALVMLEDGKEVNRTSGMSQKTTDALYQFLGVL